MTNIKSFKMKYHIVKIKLLSQNRTLSLREMILLGNTLNLFDAPPKKQCIPSKRQKSIKLKVLNYSKES